MNPRDMLLLVALGLGGVMVWRETDKRREGQSLAAPGVAPNIWAGVMPTPSTSPDILTQQRRDTLRRDLARIQNDMDVLIVQADTIKNSPAPSELRAAVVAELDKACKDRYPLLVEGMYCAQATTPDKVDPIVRERWAARVQDQLIPIRAQLSRLNSEQLATVDNLAALGVRLTAGEVKKASV